MSTTRLMILGLVQWMQPVHGYDVERELESWQAEEWANIAPGSIYHALRKLAEDGLLEEVATEQVGARPARINIPDAPPKGELEFEELLRQYWWSYRAPDRPVPGRIRVPAARCRRREAVAALRNRARVLRAGGRRCTAVALASGLHAADQKPTHVDWHVRAGDRHEMEVEIAWCERIASSARGGAPLFPEGSYVGPGVEAIAESQVAIGNGAEPKDEK